MLKVLIIQLFRASKDATDGNSHIIQYLIKCLLIYSIIMQINAFILITNLKIGERNGSCKPPYMYTFFIIIFFSVYFIVG